MSESRQYPLAFATSRTWAFLSPRMTESPSSPKYMRYPGPKSIFNSCTPSPTGFEFDHVLCCAWMGFQRPLRAICAIVFTALVLPAQYFGERVDIGGRHLYISCSGSGHEGIPTVILLSGGGSDSRAWAPMQPFLSTAAKTCSYDRAGLAKSDRGPANADDQSVVSDLHLLLGASKLHPPFVLVGHSLGGLIARLYATQFPEEVKGIFVDSYSENERRGMSQVITQSGRHPPHPNHCAIARCVQTSSNLAN